MAIFSSKFSSIKFKIIYQFVLIGLFASLGVGIFSIQIQTSALKTKAVDNLSNLLIQKKHLMNEYFEEFQLDLKETSKRYALQNLIGAINSKDEDEIDFWIEPVREDFARLATIRKRYKLIQFIGTEGKEIIKIKYRDGNAEIIKEASLIDNIESKIFKIAKDLPEHEVYISNNVSSNFKEDNDTDSVIQLATSLSAPRKGKAGVLIFTVPMEVFLQPFGKVPSGNIILVDQKGFFIYRPKYSFKSTQGSNNGNKNRLSDFYDETIVNRMRMNERGTILDHPTEIITFNRFNLLNKKQDDSWIGIYLDQRDHVLQPIEEFRVNFFLILTAVLLVVVYLAVFFAKKLTLPLRRVVSVASKIAKGNLKQKKLGFKGWDEIGLLASAFDSMIDELRAIVHQADDVAEGKLDKDYKFKGDLEKAFKKMVQQLKEKQKIEEEVGLARKNLEVRVKERTAELSKTNKKYHNEIIKRKEAEESVQKSYNFLRNILESPNDISIIATDLNKNIIYWNKGAEKMLGYTSEEMVGSKDMSVLYPECSNTGETIQNAISFIKKHKKGIAGEIEEKAKQGKRIWVKLTMSPQFDESGEVIGFLGIGENITERKLMERELRENEERFRLIIDTAYDAFISMNDEGEITQWNTQAEKIFGWNLEDALYEKLGNLIIPEKFRSVHQEGLENFLKTGKGAVLNQRIEVMALHRDGHEFPIEMTITPMKYKDSYIFNAFLQDVSERKIIQQQLNHAQKMESIGQLSAGVAHEINTPLQFIGDNTRFLQDSFGDLESLLAEYEKIINIGDSQKITNEALEKVKDVSEEIDIEFLKEEIPQAINQSLDGIARVTKIVAAMKEFSHPGEEEMRPSDLNKAIQTTLDVSRNEWKYVANVETNLDPKLPLVPCFVNDFNQVILNLIVNAAHAIQEVQKETGENGTITVTTKTEADFCGIYIKDTGTGIPEESQDKIFDPFFTTKEVGKGTGQGLALAHTMIVKKHKGTINFVTEMGKGTTFKIRLPLNQNNSE